MLDVYKINYGLIIEDTNLPIAIRLLAGKLTLNSMMTVGSFFINLTDEELESLIELTHDQDASAPELIMLSMMLASAEGTSAVDEDELISHVRMSQIFIGTAALHRKGYVTADFSKFSYGSDMSDGIIAIPTQIGLDAIEQLKKGNDYE
jgi:hypothetical protein